MSRAPSRGEADIETRTLNDDGRYLVGGMVIEHNRSNGRRGHGVIRREDCTFFDVTVKATASAALRLIGQPIKANPVFLTPVETEEHHG